MAVLWRPRRGTGAWARGLYSSRVGRRVAAGALIAPSPGLHAHQFRSTYHGSAYISSQDRGLGIQRPRAQRETLQHSIRAARLVVDPAEHRSLTKLDHAVQLRPAGVSRGLGARQP